jgi:DNA-binding LytR/AlgR family response regulator
MRIAKKISPSNQSSKIISKNETSLIHFEIKHERIHVSPKQILFLEAADHYIKALIDSDEGKVWVTRHCQLHKMLELINDENFILGNRFYIVNIRVITEIKEEKIDGKQRIIIFFGKNCKVMLTHGINQYIKQMLLSK